MILRKLAIGIILGAIVVAIMVASGIAFFDRPATSPDKPIESANYPYPIFITYASQPADQVYAITKAMIVNYDAYKDSAPGAGGLAEGDEGILRFQAHQSFRHDYSPPC